MRIVLGDITKMDTDAIVNAAVSDLSPCPGTVSYTHLGTPALFHFTISSAAARHHGLLLCCKVDRR